MKHHVCACYVRTLVYVHECTDIAQYVTLFTALQNSSACYVQRNLMRENMKWNQITWTRIKVP